HEQGDIGGEHTGQPGGGDDAHPRAPAVGEQQARGEQPARDERRQRHHSAPPSLSSLSSPPTVPPASRRRSSASSARRISSMSSVPCVSCKVAATCSSTTVTA